eukprot:6465020-Amphidinium_carterae.1
MVAGLSAAGATAMLWKAHPSLRTSNASIRTRVKAQRQHALLPEDDEDEELLNNTNPAQARGKVLGPAWPVRPARQQPEKFEERRRCDSICIAGGLNLMLFLDAWAEIRTTEIEVKLTNEN